MSIKPAVTEITATDNRATTIVNNNTKSVTKIESVNHTFEKVLVKQELIESDYGATVKQEEITIKNEDLIESIASKGIESNNKLDLKHLETQIGEHPYSCTLCDYASPQKRQLTQHLQTHKEKKTIPKPFQCTFCDRNFSWKIKLVEHLRIHTGEKPFRCSLCVYKTAWKHELLRHFRIHSGEKPFRCHVCDYKSNDKSGLNVHVRRHTGEKLFGCSFCDYKAVRKARLLKHLENHDGK